MKDHLFSGKTVMNPLIPMVRRAPSGRLAFLAVILGSASLASATAPNILFYGNSFTLSINLPLMVQQVAVADGQLQPTVTDAASNGIDLAWHIANNEAVIGGQSTHWDYVVLQEYSTKPTNITYNNLGNPSGFIADAKTLYNDVKTKSNSAGVIPILMETWSRQPGNPDLNTWYPSQPVGSPPNAYLAAANQMQSELHAYYTEATANIGSPPARLALVGDAFQALNFDSSLYASDLYHESYKGGVLAALVLFENIYNSPASSIPYTSVTSWAGGYGISSAAQWNSLTTVAVSEMPEPASLILLALGGLLILPRRHGGSV